MTEMPARQAEALAVIASQLKAGRDAAKCHVCGCFQQFVEALAPTELGQRELGSDLALSRGVFQPKRYDCLGCTVCFPAVAANALAEAFPETGASLDLCPTEAPQARAGWPPLPGDYAVVRYTAPVAVCTLHSEALSAQVAELAPEGLSIVGPMHTENLGIERLIVNIRANAHIRFLVLCGEDTQQAVGHLPGQSLQSLFEHGLDADGRIRGARGKRPLLKNLPTAEVEAFLNQVELVPMVGEGDPHRIAEAVRILQERDPGPFESPAALSTVPMVAAVEPERLVLDPAGYVVIYPDKAKRLLRVEHYTNAGVLGSVLEGATPAALSAALIERGLVTRLDHAAYIGRELARAERSLERGEPYVQDKAPGALVPAPKPACGCSSCE